MGRKKKVREDLSGILAARVSALLDIPLEGISREYCITLNGHREAIISGCTGVLLYSSEQISLRCTGGDVSVCGRNLVICSLIRDQITVHGEIGTVGLCHTEGSALC